MTNSKLERINELARLSRERELTPRETAERTALRQEYLAEWRRGAEQVLENTWLVDEKGNMYTFKRVIHGNIDNDFGPEAVGASVRGCNPAAIPGVREATDALLVPAAALDAARPAFAAWAGPRH